jgi:hypothetical protein
VKWRYARRRDYGGENMNDGARSAQFEAIPLELYTTDERNRFDSYDTICISEGAHGNVW